MAYISGTSLYKASADGTGPRELTELREESQSIRWSPDGQSLRFNTASGNPSRVLPWQIGANGSGLRRILQDWRELGGEFLGEQTPNGQHYVFSIFKKVGAGDVGTLWAMPEKQVPVGIFQRASSPPSRLGNDSRGYCCRCPAAMAGSFL